MLYFSFSCGTLKKNPNHAVISVFATSKALTPFSFLTIHISLSDSSLSSVSPTFLFPFLFSNSLHPFVLHNKTFLIGNPNG